MRRKLEGKAHLYSGCEKKLGGGERAAALGEACAAPARLDSARRRGSIVTHREAIEVKENEQIQIYSVFECSVTSQKSGKFPTLAASMGFSGMPQTR